MRDLLRRNYDIVGTVSTAGVLLITDAPWPLWLAWCGLVGYQITNRWRHRYVHA